MAFLPSHIMELTNFSARVELYTGSARISRDSGLRLRGIIVNFPTRAQRTYACALSFRCALRTLRAVFRTPLFAVADTRRIECAAHHVVTDAGKILHATSADQHDGVLLQVVPDAWNIGGYFDSVGEPDARDFAQRGIRLLGSGGVHTSADTATLRASLQRRTGSLIA